MTAEQLDELISEMTRRHRTSVEQLTRMLATDEGSNVYELAAKVAGPGVRAADWLTTAQIGLGGAVPAVLALEADGRERVMTFLMQIDQGVFV
ncbi:DUF2384 domain-containing protein [Sphingomonas sp. HDW15A]|uniref:MbcA/ParS/Xre antitoxin family protein n=1 Tax=Sphingomonas sp. HDW15A TaxID=2714942 RepID=UPI001407728B|nr:MbcA/ParS/Xre antitoxin family protein [Sphingomonas sp. HDW15A]QIK95796.1 DUF2384 domain-containing protein [Sphingomonas sp. HDW15A]